MWDSSKFDPGLLQFLLYNLFLSNQCLQYTTYTKTTTTFITQFFLCVSPSHDKSNMSNTETKNCICFQQLPRTVTITISSLGVLKSQWNVLIIFPATKAIELQDFLISHSSSPMNSIVCQIMFIWFPMNVSDLCLLHFYYPSWLNKRIFYICHWIGLSAFYCWTTLKCSSCCSQNDSSNCKSDKWLYMNGTSLFTDFCTLDICMHLFDLNNIVTYIYIYTIHHTHL